MEVSKLTISDGVRKYGSVQREVLEWLLKHPQRIKNTNARQLATAIGLDQDVHLKTVQIYQTLARLFHREILLKQGKHTQFTIMFNFYHALFPNDLREKYADQYECDGPVKITTTNKDSFVDNNGDSLSRKALRWIKEHPTYLGDVTAKELAIKIIKDTGIHTTTENMIAILNVLRSKGLLGRTKVARAYAYNYWLPGDEHEIPTENAVEDNASDEQTKEAKEEVQVEEPTPEPTEGEEKEIGELVEVEPESQIEPIKIERRQDGSINLTITLNINLAGAL